jgi:iron(III) transport system substrate-binding protein
MTRAWSVVVLALWCAPAAALARVPAGYPAEYARTIAAAGREGKVVVHATTDAIAANPLIRDFRAAYPTVEVEYHEMNSSELYNRFLAESAAGAVGADVLWSSAMDLQFKLVNDGHAQAYRSPEAAKLPEWAVWRNEAFGTTFEPIVIVYNRRLLAAGEVPHSRAELTRLLAARPERFQGRVSTYDIERSGLGFLLAAQDAKAAAGFWDLARALGAARAHLHVNTSTMMERISSGENLIAYNLLGSYVLDKARRDPAIGYVYPRDYTQVISRVAFISRGARHPNAARLWLDYLLSHRGQSVLASRSDLFALRSDVEGETTAAGLARALGGRVKPVPIGPGLIAFLDQAKRAALLHRWREAIMAGDAKGARSMKAR